MMAVNYEIFILPNPFAPAGINGIATMIQYKLGFSVGYMNLLINIPLCVLAFFLTNKDYSAKTFIFCLAFSAFLLMFNSRTVDISSFEYLSAGDTSTILAPLAASVINGFIYGCMIRLNSCTGGTDIIAAFIRIKKPNLDLMWVIFALNAIVATASYFVYGFNFEPVIVCLMYCFVTSKVSDSIIKGIKEEIKFEIITDYPEEISAEVISKLHHSCTVVSATGMYSKTHKTLLTCIINKHQVIDLQKIISNYPNSFAYISRVTETVGNFKKIS